MYAAAVAILAGISEHRMHPAFHLALVTGLRRGELLGLRWDHVDIDLGQVAVVQQLAVERGAPVITELKTESSHCVVPIRRATVKMLEDHRAAQSAEATIAGGARENSGLVFTTTLGGLTDPNNFSRLMRELISNTGVPAITPKGLRHTARSVGRVVVGDDKVMQERLGHSDVEITLGTYTHVVDEQHRRAGELIDEMFATASTPT